MRPAIGVEIGSVGTIESESPNAHDQDVPWWSREDRRDLRGREERILEQREVYTHQTVDHGQVIAYEGDRPVETAKSGIPRVGSHSTYGFGELRVKRSPVVTARRPPGPDRRSAGPRDSSPYETHRAPIGPIRIRGKDKEHRMR